MLIKWASGVGLNENDTEELQLGVSVTVNYNVKGIAVVYASINVVAWGEGLNAKELITHVIVTVKVLDNVATDVKLATPALNVNEYTPTSVYELLETVNVVPE